jgi:hypothetical protein
VGRRRHRHIGRIGDEKAYNHTAVLGGRSQSAVLGGRSQSAVLGGRSESAALGGLSHVG